MIRRSRLLESTFVSLFALAACGTDDERGTIDNATVAPFGNGARNSPSTVVAPPNLPAPSATDQPGTQPSSPASGSPASGSPASGSPASGSPAASGAQPVGATPSNEAPPGDIALNGEPANGAPSTTPSTTPAEMPATDLPSATDPAPETPPPSATPVENSGSGCTIPALPGFNQLPGIAALPDPFQSLNGQRITTREQWTCRRAEIAAEVQQFELGPKPPRPSIVTGSFANDTLTVTAGEPGRTVNFNLPIARPASAPAGRIPLLITLNGSSLQDVFTSRGIASASFDNDEIGAQANAQGSPDSRGQGLFYQVYGQNHEAGSMMAWAWGVSRIIDALEATPAANIDPTRVAVTGCSRNGKGALVIGAFDERIRLTVPQESGAGGSASWRISQVQHDSLPPDTRDDPNQTTQTVQTAQSEQPWFRANFGQFATTNVSKLPHDHHELMGMVAPRPLFVIDNTDMNWLGNESSFTDSVAASEIWNALGVQATMGASQVGGHPHCNQVPQAQLDELGRFVDKFLIGDQNADTSVLRSDRIQPDRARWIPWTTPALQ
jgi:hypothetical protein